MKHLKTICLYTLLLSTIACTSQSAPTAIPTNTPTTLPTETSLPPTSPPPLLPPLQPITVENAAGVQELASLLLPDGSSGSSQCNPAFSPDGLLLASVCGRSSLPIWEIQTGQLLHQFEPPSGLVATSFAYADNILAAAGFDGSIYFWDSTSGQSLDSIETNRERIWDLDFSTDGSLLAAASLYSGTASLWYWRAGEQFWIYQNPGYSALSIRISPSTDLIAVGYTGGDVLLFDLTSGEQVAQLENPADNVASLAFSPDGRFLAAGADDHRIWLWDLEDNYAVRSFSGHSNFINGVAFSPDGSLLVSGSHDTTLGIWDVTSGERLASLQGHGWAILRVAFSPDGTLIASTSWDGTTRLWGIQE